MNETSLPDVRARAFTIPLIFAVLTLGLHLFVNLMGGYGFFRDEFYYLACSAHPDLGYVDQPPLSIYLLGLSRAVFGDSLFAVRLLPALAGALTVYLTGRMAGQLGGGTFAQAVACLAAFVSPVIQAFAGYFSMNAFDFLCWMLTASLVVRLVTTGRSQTWLVIGLIVGLGALNKISALWLGAGIAAGLVLTPERRWLRTIYPWMAGGIAVVMFLPFVLWNVTHNFAHLEFIRNASAGKYASQSVWTFLSGQVLINGPVNVLVWGAGLVWLFSPMGKRYRVLGWMYVVPLVILVVNGHSKAEYLAPAYGMLLASGGVMIERWLTTRFLAWLKPVCIAAISAGVFLLPLGLPILPVESYIRYAAALGIAPSSAEGLRLSKLPQHYADCFGWDEMTRTVAEVYRSLPAGEKARCTIYCQNYGEAGALQFLGRAYRLPPVVSGHNSYWLWGPGEARPATVIVVGGDQEGNRRVFEQVDVAARIRSEYAIPYENDLPVYVCRGLKVSLAEIWPQTRHYQ